MYHYEDQKDRMKGAICEDLFERRNNGERRKVPACGFAYISTVGWICRREQIRRKGDPDDIAEDVSPKNQIRRGRFQRTAYDAMKAF